MRVLKRGENHATIVLFSDDDNKTDAGPLTCEWCDSELEVTIDDIQLAEIRNDDGVVIPWLFAECGNCHRPAVIHDDDLPSDLLAAIYILVLRRPAV